MREEIRTWITDEASDSELIELVSEVNSWNGSLEEYRFFDMASLNEFFDGVKPIEILEKLADDFDVTDEGFKDTIYGLESCSEEDVADDIRCNAGEVADAVEVVWENIDVPDALKEYLK